LLGYILLEVLDVAKLFIWSSPSQKRQIFERFGSLLGLRAKQVTFAVRVGAVP